MFPNHLQYELLIIGNKLTIIIVVKKEKSPTRLINSYPYYSPLVINYQLKLTLFIRRKELQREDGLY